jgi:hypothetical protein
MDYRYGVVVELNVFKIDVDRKESRSGEGEMNMNCSSVQAYLEKLG